MRCSGDAGIGIAGVTSAGTAIEPGGIRIVRGVAAVAAEHDEAGEVRREAHVFQRTEGELHLVLRRDAGLGLRVIERIGDEALVLVEIRRGAGGAGVGLAFAELKAVLHQLPREADAGSLDEAEAAHRGGLEGIPGVRDAASELELLSRVFFLLRRGLRQMLAHAIFRREEHGDLRGAMPLAEGDVFDGHAKEARKAERLDLRRCGLE